MVSRIAQFFIGIISVISTVVFVGTIGTFILLWAIIFWIIVVPLGTAAWIIFGSD